MVDVLALIPARGGSKQIPNKNFRALVDRSPVHYAVVCAHDAGIEDVWVTTDHPTFQCVLTPTWQSKIIRRPSELAQDDTPMIDVVKHALGEIPGPSDQIIVLVQPTQPLRQPKHLRAAIELLESSGADSVVSVVELPRTHSGYVQLTVDGNGRLWPWDDQYGHDKWAQWSGWLTRRQDIPVSYVRDGTVYAFRRAIVERYGNLYGRDVRPLMIPPEETCPLDTPADWAEAERRLRALSEF